MVIEFTDNLLRVFNLPIVSVLFLLVVIWLVGELFVRIKLPPVLGELLAGLIIGPPIFNLISYSDGLDMLAKLGMFFLMFYAGLQTDPKKLLKIKKSAFAIGILGTLVPFTLGFAATVMFGGTILQGIFIGAAISGTSMVTKSRILQDLKILKTKLGHIMMGSAMVDNLLSFVILAVAIKSAYVGELNLSSGLFTLGEAIVFFTLTLFIGYKLFPYVTNFMKQRTIRGFTFAILVGLLFAFLAEMLSIHFIIGAYLAGLMVREEIAGKSLVKRLKDRISTITLGLLGPIFIVTVAFNVDFSALSVAPLLFFGILIAAFFGKVIGVYFGALIGSVKSEDRLTLGWGMNDRGTVELILAVVGLQLGILTNIHVTILVLVAFITTLIVPFVLNHRIKYGLISPK